MTGLRVDLTGKRFGRLTVIGRADNYRHRTYYPDGTFKTTSMAKWKCRCDCGNEIEAIGQNLKSGRSKSCGCYMRDRLRERAKK